MLNTLTFQYRPLLCISRLLALFIVLLSSTSACFAMVIRQGEYEQRPHFIVETEQATYYFDRAGGGISRLIDGDGNDWVAFKKDPLESFPASAAAGYRGIPNALFGKNNPDAGGGHPGFDRCVSEIVSYNTIRSVTRSGQWAWSWTFTETTATMTMEKAAPDLPWWFLYEGPIAGSFAPKQKFWATNNDGPTRAVPDRKDQFFDHLQWVYFGDIRTPRALYIAQHQPDKLDDTLWFMGNSKKGAVSSADGMLVFGFGRAAKAKPLITGAGHQFTLGLIELETTGKPNAETHQRISRHITDVLSKVPPKTKKEDPPVQFHHTNKLPNGAKSQP